MLRTTIAPWLAVANATRALDYYRNAFGAIEKYRLDGDDGRVIVAQLMVDGAPFWIQEDERAGAPVSEQTSVRMILTVSDPDEFFQRAIAAGAVDVAPVHEEYGWRTGRVIDPFGYDWEFSRPLSTD